MITKTIELTYLNKATLMQDDQGNTIIWATHDRDYNFGSYYKIDKDQNVYFVIERETGITEYLLK